MRALAMLLAAALGCRGTQATPEQQPQQQVSATPADAAEQANATAVAAVIGTVPPEWHVERWMSSPPRTLASLHGSVVLVRWWTAGCPFCSTSAPALRHFDRTYGPRGLQVIGIYHHKEATPFDPTVYEETARKYGFTFPVAFDPGWRTFESWLRGRDGKPISTGYTSVTFLLDRSGVIRHVHPGGHYVEGDQAYGEMQAAIERLLAET